MNVTNEERRTLRTLRTATPSQVVARRLSIARRATALRLRGLVGGLKNVSLFFLDSNIKRRGQSLRPSVRLGATHAGMRKFAHVIATTFGCFGRGNSKRVTIVDSVTNAGKLNITPTCSTAGHFRGACVRTLTRLTQVRRLSVRFASVHPKFITASLLGDKGCPVLVGTSHMTRRVVGTLERGEQMIIVSKHCQMLMFF